MLLIKHSHKPGGIPDKEGRRRTLDPIRRSCTNPGPLWRTQREDVCRASIALDIGMYDTRTTTREMEALKLTPDPFMLEITVEYQHAAKARQREFRCPPIRAVQHTTRRNTTG